MPATPAVTEARTKDQVRIDGRLTPGSPGGLGVAADRVDVTSEAGPLQQQGPEAEHAEHDRDDLREPPR